MEFHWRVTDPATLYFVAYKKPFKFNLSVLLGAVVEVSKLNLSCLAVYGAYVIAVPELEPSKILSVAVAVLLSTGVLKITDLSPTVNVYAVFADNVTVETIIDQIVNTIQAP